MSDMTNNLPKANSCTECPIPVYFNETNNTMKVSGALRLSNEIRTVRRKRYELVTTSAVAQNNYTIGRFRGRIQNKF